MAQSSSKQEFSITSDNNLSDESIRLNKAAIQARFESLLDESSSEEEDSPLPETSDKDCNNENTRPQPSFNRRTQERSSREDDPDEVILSLMWLKGRLGAAYYNIVTSELFVMDDIMDDSNNGITKALYKQSQPRYVVTTMGIAETFLNTVKKLIVSETMNLQDDATSTSSSASGPIGASLALMPKKDYTYEICRNRVLCLKLNCEPSNASSAERATFLNSLLNFESRLMIHAIGLLLKYIDSNWNNLTLNPTGHAEFVHICYVLLEDLVMIDEETYKILGIIQSRFHPSLFKYGNYVSKEHGISLFTLLNRCQSRPGILHLWKVLRHPTRNADELKKRFEAIQYFLDPNNKSIVEMLKTCLGQVYRLKTKILNRYCAPHAKVSDWISLQKTLSQVINIGEISLEHKNSISIFEKIANGVTSDMHVVRYLIEYIVDFDMSKIQGKLIIKSGVDSELDELNNIRQKLPQILSEMAEKDLKKYSLVIERCRMIYVPDIRHVLAVIEPSSDEISIPGLEFKFAINGVRHYKSDGARELDDTIGDVLLKITRRQSQIILRLVRYISKHTGSILKSIEHCAELDTLLSFSMVAHDYNYVRPQVVFTKTINIKRGRHPLKEQLVNFVPNDTVSDLDSSLIKILTGPNACGKSIYLKQIALIVFMAHIGSFVPAESAIIGIVSHIFTQMHSVDSLAQNASSFLLSLRQINVALYASTPNSLVIIDEFGSATSEIDGLSLLTAVLQSFMERGIHCPHIFAATHIHRVIELLPKNSIVEAQTFEYVSNDDNDLVFLHRLISGKTSASFAHSVAKNAGLDDDIVQRALEVFEAKKRGTLPTPLPNKKQENTIIRIMELLSNPNGRVNLEEVKSLVKQATEQPLFK